MKIPKVKLPRLKSSRPRLKKKKTFNVTIIVLVFALLILLGVLIGSFYYTNRENRYNTEYLSYVAEQKLLSQRITTRAVDAASGQDAAFSDLLRFRNRYQQTLDYLKNGNPETNLRPMGGELLQPLTNLEQAWDEYRFNLDSIIQNRETVARISQHAVQISNVLPDLRKLSAEVARVIADAENPDVETLFVATQQSLFIEQVESNLNIILTGAEDAVTATDQFGRDFERFARFVSALSNGDALLQVQRVAAAEGQNKLAEQRELYSQVQTNIIGILDESLRFFEIKDAAAAIQLIAPEMLSAGEGLEDKIGASDPRNKLISLVGYGAGVVMIVVAILLTFIMIGDARRRERETSEINRRNQEAILRLLDEMTHLAEGDLTTHTTVTEDITGAIADSVNFSIDALRSLVETINDTVVQVSTSSKQTQSITNRLASASSQQAKEITTTTSAISRMANTMDKVSKSAMTSADVALRSVEIASKGAATVRRNIEAMDAIRETIQETSKRIKRLGESSQQIGEIVALITDIADRTNILALNAAIQASSAGEAGRGFAVVADEVQRLAERAGNATKQISVLVETIQTDTNEAVSSMEQSTAGVVRGAQLAEDAGKALAEIETVSQELANLIQGISTEAREQASAAVNISESMNVIQRITVETSEGTKETAVSVSNMTELANELRNSVAGFKLPDSGEIQTAMNG